MHMVASIKATDLKSRSVSQLQALSLTASSGPASFKLEYIKGVRDES